MAFLAMSAVVIAELAYVDSLSVIPRAGIAAILTIDIDGSMVLRSMSLWSHVYTSGTFPAGRQRLHDWQLCFGMRPGQSSLISHAD